jgi:CheY-specific phosphatase CheX
MLVGSDLIVPPEGSTAVIPHVTGVGIAGALSATLTLRCSNQSASRIASQMVGVAIDEAAAQQSDAISEICNIVAGQFKAKIGLEAECMFSVPIIITGTSYELRPRADYRLEMPFIYQAEPLWIAIGIRKELPFRPKFVEFVSLRNARPVL